MAWSAKGFRRPSHFGFAFILHAEGVNGVTTSVGGLYFKFKACITIGEGSSKLSVLACVPPHSLFDMGLQVGLST